MLVVILLKALQSAISLTTLGFYPSLHQLATTFISTFDGNRGTVTSRTTPTSITAQFYHDDCLKRAQ